jgi:hypothetical protein
VVVQLYNLHHKLGLELTIPIKNTQNTTCSYLNIIYKVLLLLPKRVNTEGLHEMVIPSAEVGVYIPT